MSEVLYVPPVAIFGFNRPDCLKQVFDRVREVKPQILFLVLDAPRNNRPDDIPKVEECKKILANIDWECEIHRNYAEENLGCRWRMTSGISWVFEHVEEAILLEDDCVPHLDFFRYCGELLVRYRHDMRVGMIAGHLAHFEPVRCSDSYYFDRFNTIIGWATWKRSWTTFDQKMEEWPRFKAQGNLYTVLVSKSLVKRFSEYFDRVYEGRVSSWATAWFLTCIRQGFLCIHPTVNLITNVGIEGAHNNVRSVWHFVPSEGMTFPLAHPKDVVSDWKNEEIMRRMYDGRTNIIRRVVRKLKFILRVKQ